MWIRVLALAVMSTLVACGPIIGDPCTVNTQCGPGLCLNRDYTPGGLCSLVCTPGSATCPAGSVCVSRAVDNDTAGCLLSCTKDADCRTGYVCRSEGGNSVCVGPGGI